MVRKYYYYVYETYNYRPAFLFISSSVIKSPSGRKFTNLFYCKNNKADENQSLFQFIQIYFTDVGIAVLLQIGRKKPYHPGAITVRILFPP